IALVIVVAPGGLTPFPAVFAGLSAFFAAFLTLAHRAFCARAILFRPSALITPLGGLIGIGLEIESLDLGRPGPFLTSVPASRAFACCNLEISTSRYSMIVAVSMNPPIFIVN